MLPSKININMVSLKDFLTSSKNSRDNTFSLKYCENMYTTQIVYKLDFSCFTHIQTIEKNVKV